MKLDELGKRIERVALGPEAIEAQRMFRVVGAIFALAGWRARVKSFALQALVGAVAEAARAKDAAPARKAFDAAVKELEENVDTIERAAILRKRAPVAHAAWLRRAWEMVMLAERALEAIDAGSADDVVRQVTRAERAALLPPLSLRATKDDEKHANAFVGEVATRDEPAVPDADGRLLELELAAIDRLLDAARAEGRVLGRKRRLLVAARQRILDATAALPIDPGGARARADFVAREIARLDRLESAGLDANVGLVHQARLAIDRGDRRLVYAALAALDGAALAAGDTPVHALTGRGINALWEGADPSSPEALDASVLRSAEEMLGKDIASAVSTAFADARADAEDGVKHGQSFQQQNEAHRLRAHATESGELETLRACVAVDGCFEVGGALAPVRIVEEDRVLRQVRHPTQQLLLVPAREIEDLPDAIVADPRTILLDLAAGRMLARRYVADEIHRKVKTRLRSEVRVYVLDGSGSMKGPRGRVRDAMLVAELATLVTRLRSAGTTRCTLFYRYFDDELGPVVRVDGVAAAKAAIRDVVATVREGGTDIEKALLASLAQIETARELDPDLARAQVVLVTDGESAIDEAKIVAAREAIRGIPIGVSVVALGEENPALRALVARQRAKGEPAFYHFVDDERLAAIASGAFADGLPVHLPDATQRAPALVARELEAEIGPIVDELASLDRARDVAAIEAVDAEKQANAELGLGHEGERARHEALSRDRAALESRFARWFPQPIASSDVGRAPADEDAMAVTCALASIAEVVALLGGSELARRADAIELLERILPDARLTPARYHAVLRDAPAAVAAPLAAIHAAVRPAE
ncbi:MAG TPA: hypothetical protein VIF62_08455 [Labilithrix sp.]